MARFHPAWLPLSVFLLVVSCGGGGSSGAPDLPTSDLPADVADDADVLSADDGDDPGGGRTDVFDVVDVGDPGDVQIQDLPDVLDVPDVPPTDASGCLGSGECAGRVGSLGPCEEAACVEGRCVKAVSVDTTPCQDGNACSGNDTCVTGVCTAGPNVDCDDGRSCTLDVCVPATGCQHTNLQGPCDDHTACIIDEQCVEGECVGKAVVCEDLNSCTQDSCDAVIGCVHAPLDGPACDDGSVCTDPEACVEGLCKGMQLPCDDGNVCTEDTCDPVGGCGYAPLTGGLCDDASACTTDDRCDAGTCTGTPLPCDDGDPCTDDGCAEGICTHVHDQAVCDDLSSCTTGDVCSVGICAGTPVICNTPPANQCVGDQFISHASVGACGPAGCEYPTQIVTCAEGCAGGVCIGDPCAGIVCGSGPTACFSSPGTCNRGSCSWAFDDAAQCDDGNVCTIDDGCSQGVCAGRPAPCMTPPPDTCLDARTLSVHRMQGTCDAADGRCSYAVDPVVCAGGCVDGICLESLGLLQADLTPAGLNGLQDGTHSMSCVMPGWAEGAKTTSTVYVMTAGFEP